MYGGEVCNQFMEDYSLNQDQFNKINKKYSASETFKEPSNDTEKVFALDWLIDKLTCVKNSKWGSPVDLDVKALKFIIDEAANAFSNDTMLLELSAPIKVCGDTHGQFFDLFRIFEIAGWPSTSHNLLFIGDYVDRGK